MIHIEHAHYAKKHISAELVEQGQTGSGLNFLVVRVRNGNPDAEMMLVSRHQMSASTEPRQTFKVEETPGKPQVVNYAQALRGKVPDFLSIDQSILNDRRGFRFSGELTGIGIPGR